ncbi:unnamed protein product [Amaranthus hypochondriacus]
MAFSKAILVAILAITLVLCITTPLIEAQDYSPTDPDYTPTDPGDTPTDPGDTPTDPGDTPTDPGDTPTDPGDTPTDPGDTPTDPGDTPTDPGDTPTDPGDAPSPTDPGDTPTDPGDAPGPTDPGDTPTDPGDAPGPTDPGDTPTDPGDAPSPTDPGDTPTDPGDAPGPTDPGDTPTDPGDAPSPTDPGDTPTDPGDTPPTDPGHTPTTGPGHTPTTGPGHTPTPSVPTRGGQVSISEVVTDDFFNGIIGQASSSCAGKNFYSRSAFLDAVNNYPNFGNHGSSDVSLREIAAFFAHATHETAHFCYIEEIRKATYCLGSAKWPCNPNKQYYGRGPLQLTWNYNYGPAGQTLGFDGLNAPETVANDPRVSFSASLWFWMKNMDPLIVSGRGFGSTIRAINSGECDGKKPAAVRARVGYFTTYCNHFGVDPGSNLSC